MASRHAIGLLLLATLGLACGKTNRVQQGHPTTTPTGGTGSGGGASEGGGGAGDVPLVCADPHPGPSAISRLTPAELNRSVLSQVPPATKSEQLPWLDVIDTPSGEVSALLVEDIHLLAHAVALLLTDATAGATAFAGCNVAAQGEATCRDQFVTHFLERAYRRPLTDEDHTEMSEVFATGKQLGGDFKSGARAVIEVALQNPDFVYLLEQGNGESKGDSVALTSFETAARLAYFLTGAPPDDALFAAAKNGPLGPTELEAQARRLVGTKPNRELVGAHYKRLFTGAGQALQPDLGYTTEIAQLADQETTRFVEDVIFDGAGTFRALVTEPSTWVNEPLARFYGYPAVTGQAFQKVQLDPRQRGGLFTQASFLKAYSQHTNPMQRSMVILRNLLCHELPPPPADIPAGTVVDVPQFHTTRERYTFATKDEFCQRCHKDMNPVGFAFEHYDAVGKWRDTEDGSPIDSSGELYVTDAKGPFKSAIDLLHNIGESDDAKKCAVGRWLGEAYRRDEAPEDACAKAELSKAFLQSDGKVTDLLVDLAHSDNFRYRLKSELAP